MDLGQLTLRLATDATAFESGLLKMEQKLNSSIDTFRNFGSNVEKVMSSIEAHPIAAILTAALAAFNALKGATTGTINELKSLADAGEAAGLSQQRLASKLGLSGSEAAGLKLQAGRLGLDLDAVTQATAMYEVQLGRAIAGNEQAGQAFARLGLDAAALGKMKVTDQIGAIGDALKQLPPGVERTSAAYAILGRHARDLLPIILEGKKGIADAAAQSTRWGLTFSDADARAIKSANMAEKAADQAISSIRQSFANGIAVAFAPVKQLLGDALAGGVDMIQPLLQPIRDGIAAVGGYIGDITDGLRAGFSAMLEPISEAWDQLKGALGTLEGSLGTTSDWHSMLRYVGFVVGNVIGQGLKFTVDLIKDGVELTMMAVTAFKVMDAVIRQSIAGGLESVTKLVIGLMHTVGDQILKLLDLAAKLPDKLGGGMFKQAARDARQMFDSAEAKVDDISKGMQQGIQGGLNFDFQLPKIELPKMDEFKEPVDDAGKLFDNHIKDAVQKVKDLAAPKALTRGSAEALNLINAAARAQTAATAYGSMNGLTGDASAITGGSGFLSGIAGLIGGGPKSPLEGTFKTGASPEAIAAINGATKNKGGADDRAAAMYVAEAQQRRMQFEYIKAMSQKTVNARTPEPANIP